MTKSIPLRIRTAQGGKTQWARRWATALGKATIWLRAMKVGLPVGILQVIVNQGDAWMLDAVTWGVVVKSILSPLLSFSIALSAAAGMDVQEQIREGTRDLSSGTQE